MTEEIKGFDHVSLKMPGGGYNLISKEEFLNKPLNERIDLVLSGSAEFIYEGKIISAKQALESLRNNRQV